jgi:S-(hydroxymethyl)glutathione dehydrogenase/alcohol dehydrogenase
MYRRDSGQVRAAEPHPGARDFPRCIRLAETGRLDLGGMVSRRITLDEVNEGIELLERGEGVRTVIV